GMTDDGHGRTARSSFIVPVGFASAGYPSWGRNRPTVSHHRRYGIAGAEQDTQECHNAVTSGHRSSEAALAWNASTHSRSLITGRLAP
ncbi:hypothetical protein AB0K24_51980, partial [Streptomyces mirabilis]|uniref:hypothetical protein n=1 Tax=Streptomyces mirabilis TaxID=68239 RepID=UPI00341C3D7B